MCYYLPVQVTELKLKVDNVERERDFYFDKLRDIEILCQMPLLQNIPVSALMNNVYSKARNCASNLQPSTFC